jgi:hypothetical protein
MPVRPAFPIRRRCRASLAWLGLSMLAAILFLDVIVDHWPRLHDPEFGTRLDLLRGRMAQAPEKPVLIFVGSSRVGLGFLPEQMPEVRTLDGQSVLAFNCSHLAAGPVMNLVQVQRVLRAGIRPRWIVVELAPFILPDECTSTPTTNAGAADLPTLFRYIRASKVAMVYLRCRLNPWYKHRQTLIEEFAPTLARPRQRPEKICLGPQGGDNFWYHPETLPPEEVQRRTNQILAEDRDRLQHYHIAPAADRAMRELLDLCRARDIGVAVVMLPESSQYRGLYSAETQRTIREYVADLERSSGVPIIDARAWLADDSFSDCNHVFRAAGVVFTRRVAAEVFQPLVEGRLQHRPASPDAGRALGKRSGI